VPTPPFGRAAAALLLVLAAAVTAPADDITFKDGYTVSGKVKRESGVEIDPFTQESMAVPVFKGYWILDDGPRYVLFNQNQVGETRPADYRGGSIELFRPTKRFQPQQLPAGAAFVGAPPPFGKDGRRTLYLSDGKMKYPVDQHLTFLSPYFTRIDAINYNWTVMYRTSELGPDLARSLAEQHPDIREEPGKPDAGRRMKLCRFLVQAGWYDEAERELDRIEKDLPGEKPRVAESREAIKGLRADKALEEVEHARRAGRHQWAQAALPQIDKLYGPLNDARVIRSNTLKGQYDDENRRLREAKKAIDQVLGQVNGPDAAFACLVLGTIRSELDLEGAARLDFFVTQAQQAERDRQAGRRPQQSPAELTALAVTGWLLGKTAAEAKPDSARKLWQARELVLEMQRTGDPAARRVLLDGFLKETPPPFDVMAQLVSSLPPPEAEGNPGPTPHPCRITAPATGGRGRYWLQLPPEYRPNRPYPVLLVLREGHETSEDALKRWAPYAARDGYILAAPAWGNDLDPNYDYDGSQQPIVLDTLRDLKQRYRVDADRVFLFGFADGANLALDVGLSHPDLFAGVIPMCPFPRWDLVGKYWRNAQYLPFYLICGDITGDAYKKNRMMYEEWATRAYNSIMVVCKGRGHEFFGGELPTIFDWMAGKKRAGGFPELGRNPGGVGNNEEFQSVREADNRFYWLTLGGLQNRCVWNPANKVPLLPAKVQASIRPNNQIVVWATGVTQLSLWIGPEMIDVERPVTVTVQTGRGYPKIWPPAGRKTLTPDLGILLEDYYQRADQRRLFFVRLDFDKL
jgi:pimeloyl-ACP methyl ester carboxylesterase